MDFSSDPREHSRSAAISHGQGLAHARRGAFAEALACYDRALSLTPEDPELLLNRSSALRGLDRREEALAQLGQILTAHPHHLGALNNRGTLLLDLGRPGEALACFARALQVHPDHAALHTHRAMALRALERPLEARASYERAIALDPCDPRSLCNLANLLAGTPGQHDFGRSPCGSLIEAIPLYRRVLELDPAHADAGRNLGSLLLELGHVEESVAVLEASLAAQLAAAEAECSPPGCASAAAPLPAVWANLLMTRQYLPGAEPEALAAEARRWGERAHRRAGALLGHTPRRPAPDPHPGRPLRVGYLSGDLTMHPVGLFLRSVLMAHDPGRITPFLYDNGSPAHRLNERLGEGARRKGGEHRRVETLDDLALARQIREDRIDILVDLAGHTARSRLEALALRPAPLQLSWLGYFASTGLAAIDAVILDPWCAPPGSEHQFCETILRLPHTRFCFQPPPFAPAVEPSPFERNGFLTFGSFNNAAKLNRQVLACWARLLVGVPDSRLLLQWRTFADPAVAAELRTFMAAQGVAAERLELRAAVPAYGDFLACYSDIDLALDPFPFCGGQSSCEALWMGVPVLTLPGATVVSRQTLGFLGCLGLEQELAATHQADYVGRAIGLAKHPYRLVELRKQLRDRMAASPLCDPQRFTADLEDLFSRQWEQLRRSCNDGRQGVLDLLAELQPGPEETPLAAALAPLRQQPDTPALLRNLGELLRRRGQPEEALICLQRALSLQPDDPIVHYNLGTVQHELGQLPEAIAAYRQAIQLDPSTHRPWVNLGTALVEHGQAEGAVQAYQQALRLDPELPVAHSNLAKSLLETAGDAVSWQRAWQAYDWRFRHRPELLKTLPGPRWHGENTDSDTLVLVAEQGLGDTLQFSRYARSLRQRFRRLLFHGHPKLAALLLDSGLIDGHESDPQALADIPWIPLLSLPGLLEVSRDQPLETPPYLQVDVAAVQRWHTLLHQQPGLVVAIHWQGDPNHERLASRGRSLPLEAFAPLARIPGVRLVSLQKGAGSEQLANCRFRDRFVACQEQIDVIWDFQETAAILKACDQVISSDTALVHLAGGLGLPVWVLLKRFPEWRWGREGSGNGWYPAARLFRQPHPGDWRGLMAEVRDQLALRAGSPDATGADATTVETTTSAAATFETTTFEATTVGAITVEDAGPRPGSQASSEQLLTLLGRRSASIVQVVTLLRPLEHPRILELGATRSYRSGVIDDQTPQARIEDWDWGGGCASYVLPALLPHAGLTTVDVSAAALAVTRTLTEPFRGRVERVQISSTAFLERATNRYDMIYMDHGETSAATAALHLADARLIVERDLLNPGGLILIDDHGSPAGDGGKGALSLPYLLEQGFNLLSQPGWYQALLQKGERRESLR